MPSAESSSKSYHVAIIGGGFSGTAAAYHLLYEAKLRNLPFECVLFEPNELIGAGIAYGTKSAVHLLNVRAAGMTLDDRHPNSFTEWLGRNFPEFNERSFVPRMIYRRYLESALKDIQDGAESAVKLQIVNQTVTSIDACGSYALATKEGGHFTAEKVVLALGNLPFESRGMKSLQTPWDEEALHRAAAAQEVVLLGSGLTAVDTVLSLESLSYQGRYTIISRHGLLPEPHLDIVGKPPHSAEQQAQLINQASTLRNALRVFRAAVRKGVEWRGIIDALRPFTQNLWSRFSLKEKRSFISHLRPYWEVHRHRVPDESLAQLTQLMKRDRLAIVSARCLEVGRHSKGIEVILRKRAQARSESLRFDAGFNCAGLCSDIRRSDSPLLKSMVSRNLASYDDLFLGIRTTMQGELVDSGDMVVPKVYALGPLRRGGLWETTAAREIRAQAAGLAGPILDRC